LAENSYGKLLPDSDLRWRPESGVKGSSFAMQVSGHQAWTVTFLMTYPDAASEGLALPVPT
jgi:hypothetical protein